MVKPRALLTSTTCIKLKTEYSQAATCNVYKANVFWRQRQLLCNYFNGALEVSKYMQKADNSRILLDISNEAFCKQITVDFMYVVVKNKAFINSHIIISRFNAFFCSYQILLQMMCPALGLLKRHYHN